MSKMKTQNYKKFMWVGIIIGIIAFVFHLGTAFAQTELITNGTFQSGSAGWVLSSNFYADSRFSSCRSCPGYSYVSNPDGTSGNNLYGYMYQSVAIPSNATSITLTFWCYITTQESGSVSNDFLNVTLQNSAGQFVASIAMYSNRNASAGYIKQSFDLMPLLMSYKGQTIRLHFLATTNPSYPTTFRIDDVSIFATLCNYSIFPTSQSFPSSGGPNSVNVTTGSGCNWSAQTHDPWIIITSGNSGSGNGTVNYSVAANTSMNSRTGTMTIAGQIFTVNQAGQTCTYSIFPTSQSFPSSGGPNSVNVTTGSGCNWSAQGHDPWITITSGKSGIGSGTVNYSVAANTGMNSRTGTMTIAGQTFPVNQDGQTCTYSISPMSQSFPSNGGSNSVNVTTGSGCNWSAQSDALWITITSGKSGIESGTVNYSVAANTGMNSRTGKMTIAGKTFTVTQIGTTEETFRWPLDNPNWSNGYGAFNRADSNHMYHTGIDLSGSRRTTIKASANGSIIKVFGLAPRGGGKERVYLWNDSNGNGQFDNGEEEVPIFTGRIKNNHGVGMTIIIQHSNGKYSLYGHLDAIRKDLYDKVIIQNQSVPVNAGEPIALMGFTTYDNQGVKNIHVHFEIKDRGVLGNNWDDDNDTKTNYWGYTPDLPDPYGYNDPQLYIYPPPIPSTKIVAVRVINEEGGNNEADRGIRVYTGPGAKYSVLGWTGKDQVFVANATVMSTTLKDEIPRLWYKICLPNKQGPSYGWIAFKRKDGTLLIQEDPYATILTIINGQGTGWQLRRSPNVENFIRIWDNVYQRYLNVLAWNDLKFVRSATQTLSNTTWHGIDIPKFYFDDPKTTSKIAPSQDNVVGQIEIAWLSNDAVLVSEVKNPPIPLPATAAYGKIPGPGGDQTHTDKVLYSFPGQSGDLNLTYEVYDIDNKFEMDILLNGTKIRDEDITTNNNWSSRRTLLLPNSLVNDAGYNFLTFDNTMNPNNIWTWYWGIRNVSIAPKSTISTQVIPSPEVSLTGYQTKGMQYLFDGQNSLPEKFDEATNAETDENVTSKTAATTIAAQGHLLISFQTEQSLDYLLLYPEENAQSLFCYRLEASLDGQKWQTLVDKTHVPVEGIQLDQIPGTKAQFLRISGWGYVCDMKSIQTEELNEENYWQAQEKMIRKTQPIDLAIAELSLFKQEMMAPAKTEVKTLPTSFTLAQNFPNPFNPNTVINFELPEPSKVNINLCNESGQLVRTLVNSEMTAGRHSVRWNGRNQSGKIVAAGVYFYRIVVKDRNGKSVFMETKRMTFLK